MPIPQDYFFPLVQENSKLYSREWEPTFLSSLVLLFVTPTTAIKTKVTTFAPKPNTVSTLKETQ